MQLLPTTNVKKFSECLHLEIFEFIIRNQVRTGICILDDDDSEDGVDRSILTVESDDETTRYLFSTFPEDQEVLSYGSDWVLSPKGPPLVGDLHVEDAGSIIHTPNGVFIVAKVLGHTNNTTLCRLSGDGACILNWQQLDRRGFAYEFWRIGCCEANLNREHILARKESIGTK